MRVNYRTLFALILAVASAASVTALVFLPSQTGTNQPETTLLLSLLAFTLVLLLVVTGTLLYRLLIKPITALTHAIENRPEDGTVRLQKRRSLSEIDRLHVALDHFLSAEGSAKAHISHLAYHDSLTGLANRHLFITYLEKAISAADRDGHGLALLFIDLDNFKIINDHYGHQIGDRVLTEFANRIKRIVRGSDLVSSITLDDDSNVARLAGDEFAILLTGLTDANGTVAVAERILESTHDPVIIDSQDLYIQTSIGIANYPEDGRDADELIRHSDAAMYQAKTSGKHTYHVFSRLLSKKLHRQRQVQAALRTALLNDEFFLEFQPYVESQGFTLAGVELLLRWRSGALGLVSPSEFVPIAESCGLMRQIDAWVVGECCQLLSAWHEQGLPPIPCSINISTTNLRHPTLLTFVDACVKSYGLSPHELEFEITETKLVDHDERCFDVLQGLRDLGFTLALDDFGCGFTSLNQLKAFPVHKLKIDRMFVEELRDSGEPFRIADIILVLCRSYALCATAEGVETVEQAHYLSNSGCHFLQGNYFSKPISRWAFESLLSQGSVRLPLSEDAAQLHTVHPS